MLMTSDDNRLFNGINNANRIAHIRVNHNLIRFSNMIRIMSENGSFKCDLILLRKPIGLMNKGFLRQQLIQRVK